ncbi:aldo/keto reductase [Nodosilinea sp. LEGE 07088]|uniref:aldo/keto reductase n=1 Tax=Nodosilinea sp. LEGE 07088 TaxID=2777968 RepID=UPI0018821782|nr:aldo/keto reductase [Nodosilinea sp. LEGE 07088]MBE9141230.1 aldo/keto reductase [Nodosilinea sp. LEGE 07088]
MDYRRFGRTNLSLSVLSLGTMRALASEQVFGRTLQAGLALGINHIETAQGYGASERWLGRFLKTADLPANLVVTTKITPQPDAETMAQHIEASLERLGLDVIHCLAIHGLNTPEHLAWVSDPQGCMAAVRRFQTEGKIGHVGFSTHGSQEVIAGAIATDQFDFVNLHYYYFFQHHAPMLDLAAERDMGIFIISPGDKGGMLYSPPDRLADLCAPFTPLELTYRWLLSDRRITTLSTGPATPEELSPLQDLADQTQPLSSEELAALERLSVQAAAALGSDRCAQCYDCLPCPEAIHIPEVLRLRNLAVAYDMQAFGTYRYRMFENAGHWFPGRKANRCTDCGDCLPRCPENLDIPTLLRDTHDRLQGPARRRLWDD